MRTRREFTPVVDFMPSRISPSAAGAVLPAAIFHGVSLHPAPPVLHVHVRLGAMDDTSGDNDSTSTIIAGEPTPPSTINC